MARCFVGVACLCLLALSPPGAHAQETSTVRVSQSDASSLQSRSCFRPRPIPQCHSYWITEFGLLRFITSPPGDRLDERRTLFSWEAGRMVNRSPGRAIGGTAFLAANDNQFRLGVRGRYRIWNADGTAMEVGPGIILLQSDVDLDIRPYPGAAVQAAFSWHDRVVVVGQAELTRGGAGLQLGVRAGGLLGAVAGIGLPVLALILVGEDQS